MARTFNSYKGPIRESTGSVYSRASGRGIAIRGPSHGGSTTSSVGFMSSKPRRSLTPKEIDDKRANNMCFFCDERYYLGHKCSSQVYRLEIIEGEEKEEEII